MRPEYYRSWRLKHPSCAAVASKLWRNLHPGLQTLARQNWRKANKEKVAAHQKVKQAVKNGKLIRQPCLECGNLSSQAHHEDYDKPLDVSWLCLVHHRELHRRQRNASFGIANSEGSAS